jgi:hypothetical protein
LLPLGTVCFDEIVKQNYIGRILKPPTLNLKESNGQGKIIFDFNDEYVIFISKPMGQLTNLIFKETC